MKLSEKPLVHETAQVQGLGPRPLCRGGGALPRQPLEPRRLFLLRRGHADRLCRDRQVRQHRGERAHLRQPAPDAAGLAAPLHLSLELVFRGRGGRPGLLRLARRERHRHRPRHLDRAWRGDHAGGEGRQRGDHRLERGGDAGTCRTSPSPSVCRPSRSSSGSPMRSRSASPTSPGGTGRTTELHAALPDFRALEIEAFLEKYE